MAGTPRSPPRPAARGGRAPKLPTPAGVVLPVLPKAGSIVAGKYEIIRIVGEGGMGVVYEAMHTRMRQRVALKVLQPETLVLPDVVARFEREARASGQLRSQHAARVVDVDQTTDGLPYMVMEFLEGQDLGSEIDSRGKIPLGEALDYTLQACVAIVEAHDLGIVHRDLKPSNLFLARGPDGIIVKLLDFGISKVNSEADKLTSAESVMGTPLYMSPEQVRSARNVDARADVWSLGVILYELLSGQTPFSGTTTQVAAAVVTDDIPPILTQNGAPAALQDVVLRALTRDLRVRFQSVRELASALLVFADPQSKGALGMDAVLAGGARAFSAPTSPSTRNMIASGASGSIVPPSGRISVHDDAREHDATVRSGPIFVNAANAPNLSSRPPTERSWAKAGEKKKTSPLIYFGVAALLLSAVIGAVFFGIAKRNARLAQTIGAGPAQSSQTIQPTPSVAPAQSAQPTPVAQATTDDTKPAASSVASFAAIPSAAPSAVASKPPTIHSGIIARPPHATAGGTAAPITSAPPAQTIAAPSALPNHL